MTDILTVTVNPAIDIATATDCVVPGPKLRCGPARIDPGGGGVNVARAISRLGGKAKAIVAVGGPTGESLIAMVRADDVFPIPVTVSGQTRQNLAVTDNATGEQYRFSLLSDTWTPEDENAVIAAIQTNTISDSLVVLSGGIAPGMSAGFHARVQGVLRGITSRLIIDTCEPALSHLITQTTTPYYVLRLDQNEAALAAGHDLEAVTDNFAFGTKLIKSGVAEIVVIGHGAKGSVLVSRDQCLFCHAPKVKVASKIGAGDAFVGAFTLSLSRQEPLETALQRGVAAACATVATEGTALCTLQATQALLPGCRVDSFSR